MNSAAADKAHVLDTTLLDGRLRLRQLARGHRAGTDAVLLSALVGAAKGTLIDLGAGTGAAGLAVALRNPDLQTILIEREEELAVLARENAALNGLAARTRVVAADGLSPSQRAAHLVEDARADIVLTNPPFLDATRSRTSPDPLRASAHSFAGSGSANLETWLRACSAMLRPRGIFGMIHRADAMGEVLKACEGRFGAIAITPVHARSDQPALRILVRAIKGSRGPLKIHLPLILHAPEGGFEPRAAAIHAGIETFYS